MISLAWTLAIAAPPPPLFTPFTPSPGTALAAGYLLQMGYLEEAAKILAHHDDAKQTFRFGGPGAVPLVSDVPVQDAELEAEYVANPLAPHINHWQAKVPPPHCMLHSMFGWQLPPVL